MTYHHRRPSYWEIDRYYRRADYTVLGAGIVGTTAALRLRERFPKARIVLLERGNLPAGASTRNAGFACFGSPGELLDDLETIGAEATAALVKLRLRGLERLRNLVGDGALQYADAPAYELLSEADFARIAPRLPELNALLQPICGQTATYRTIDSPLPEFSRAVQIFGEGQLHPAAMMEALHERARRADIQTLRGIELTHWSEREDGLTLWNDAQRLFLTRHLLICTNGFAKKLLPELDVQTVRNQVLITKPLSGKIPEGNFHLERGYVYFRNVGNRILLGGGRHLDFAGETTDQFGGTEAIEDYLTGLLHERILPGRNAKITARWSGILGVGPSREPIVRRVSDRIGVAVRLGGMGVAIGALVGKRAGELFR